MTRFNIMSAGPLLPVEALRALCERENDRDGRVPVMSTVQGKVVATVIYLELVGQDVWADLMLLPGEKFANEKRAIGFAAVLEGQTEEQLIGVMLTNLERYELERYLEMTRGVEFRKPYPKPES